MTDPLLALLELAGVSDAVDQARAAVDELLANRTLRRRASDVSAESALRGAWSSAWLAGARVPLEDLRAGQVRIVGEPILQGALRAQAAIAPLVTTWRHACRQALARLHTLAAGDMVADRSVLGRPLPAAADRLDTLATVLGATSVPAVVIAAIVQGEVLALDAFAPASGLVARAAVRLTLIDRGLDPRSLVVIEAGHRELGTAYEQALAGYRDGTPEGIGTWICHCAEATVLGAREAVAICEMIAAT